MKKQKKGVAMATIEITLRQWIRRGNDTKESRIISPRIAGPGRKLKFLANQSVQKSDMATQRVASGLKTRLTHKTFASKKQINKGMVGIKIENLVAGTSGTNSGSHMLKLPTIKKNGVAIIANDQILDIM